MPTVIIFLLFVCLSYTITDPPPQTKKTPLNTAPPLHHSFFFILTLPPSTERSHPFLHLPTPPTPVSPLPQKHSRINFNTICSLKARACLCQFFSSSPLKGHTRLSSLILRSLLQISYFLSQKPKHATGSDWA